MNVIHAAEKGAASRGRRREETTERIVETALRVLGEEGFEALTIQRLAKELGYAVGALYRYFKSKDALLVAMLHRVMDRYDAELRQAISIVEEEEGNAEEGQQALLKLFVAGEVYVSLARRRPAEFGLVSTLIGDPRELLATEEAGPLLAPMLRHLAQLTQLFHSAGQSGALSQGEPGPRTVCFWAALQGVLQLRKLGRFGVATLRFDELPPELLACLFRGWGAPEAATQTLLPRARELVAQSLEQSHKETEGGE